MRHAAAVAVVAVVAVSGLAVLLPAGCNPSRVRPGDPLHAFVDGTYFLARPLSGPRFRNPNAFGHGARLPAGARVEVVAFERVVDGAALPRVASNDPHAITRTRAALEAGNIYRILFRHAGLCPRDPCVAHWRAPDDDAFRAAFLDVFSPEDPLAGLSPAERAGVAAYEVAPGMTPERVLLAIGEPNTVARRVGVERWIYEVRGCDADGRYLALPRYAVELEDGRVARCGGLDTQDFYVTNEPYQVGNGLCWFREQERDHEYLPATWRQTKPRPLDGPSTTSR